MLSQIYSEEPHPIEHKFVIVRDNKTTISIGSMESSSESISGSFKASNKNIASTDSDMESFSEGDEKEKDVNDHRSTVNSFGDLLFEDVDENINVEKIANFKGIQENIFANENADVDKMEHITIKTQDLNNEEVNPRNDDVSYNYLHSYIFYDSS